MQDLVLGFDTSAAHCVAALLSGETVLAHRAEGMVRGQAERLMPLLEEVLSEGGVAWRDLTALGVGTGPGNFTGIRIAVSAARGLALGLDIPAVGVNGCEARALLSEGSAMTAIPAPRDRVYLCDSNHLTEIPQQLSRSEAEDLARSLGRDLEVDSCPDGLAEAIARIAGRRWRQTDTPPAPFYARPADALPSPDRPPVLLDG